MLGIIWRLKQRRSLDTPSASPAGPQLGFPGTALQGTEVQMRQRKFSFDGEDIMVDWWTLSLEQNKRDIPHML